MRSPENTFRSLRLACFLVLIACSQLFAASRGEITGVVFQADKRQLVITTKGPVGKHVARVIGRPNRLVLDIQDVVPGRAPRKVNGSKADVHEIRVGTYKSAARIVVDFRDLPVPPYNVQRNNDTMTIAFGEGLQADPAQEQESSSDRQSQPSASETVPDFKAPAAAGADSHRGVDTVRLGRPALNAPATSIKAAAPAAVNVQPETKTGDAGKDNEPGSDKNVKVAQATPDANPASSLGEIETDSAVRPVNPPPAGPARDVRGPIAAATPPAAPLQLNREVKPPVTPPTPDPRLLVQEITELRFIQVGHNSRLMIRGGDHLDYRLNKISPTKARLDLINAEIPKAHQSPLRTDLWSTSVEMIVPGSQSIFIQLKDAVPYQVEKKKGVLMVDFPPPRFVIPTDQAGKRIAPDAAARAANANTREAKLRATRAAQEARLTQQIAEAKKRIQDIDQEINTNRRQLDEAAKRYLMTVDPEVFNKPITMDFQGIALRNAFRLLAEQAGINIIVDNDIQGNVTMRLFQVPLGQVMDTILQGNGLSRVMIGNVMRVGRTQAVEAFKANVVGEYNKRRQAFEHQIERLREDRDRLIKNIGDIERERTADEAAEMPKDDPRTEEFGEAGCVKVGEQTICFYYANIKVVYTDPAKIVNTLQCMFNLKCVGLEQQGLSPAAREADRLKNQGFQLNDSYAVQQIQATQTVTAQRQQAAAQGISAGAALGARLGDGLTSAMDPALKAIIANSMMWADKDNRAIFLKDTAERLQQIKKVITSLDMPTPQVLIESRMVNASKDWARGIGIQWGGRNYQTRALGAEKNPLFGLTAPYGAGLGIANAPTVGAVPALGDVVGTRPTPIFAVDVPSTVTHGGLEFQFGFLAGNYLTDLDVKLTLGEDQSQVKNIARPKVQVLNGMAATIESGTKIPYPNAFGETQFIDATLKLEVTPQIFADGRIQMLVTVTDNTPGAIDVSGRTQINIRSTKSTLIVKDGDTVVIGGIARNQTARNTAGWPGLMHMPLISTLFSNKSSRASLEELLVFLTPSIVKRPPPAP